MANTVRRALVAGIAVVATALLPSCSVRIPTQESLETAIPTAFEGSNLGIIAASAGTSNDGLAVDVWASAEFEADTVTADNLRDMLKLAVDNIDLSDVNTLEILATVGPFRDSIDIDLSALGEELGFAAGETETFTAPYDEVVDFLSE